LRSRREAGRRTSIGIVRLSSVRFHYILIILVVIDLFQCKFKDAELHGIPGPAVIIGMDFVCIGSGNI